MTAVEYDDIDECEFALNFIEDGARDLLSDLAKVSTLDVTRLRFVHNQIQVVGFLLGDSLKALDSLILQATQEQLINE